MFPGGAARSYAPVDPAQSAVPLGKYELVDAHAVAILAATKAAEPVCY